MTAVGVLLIAAACSAIGTGCMRRYALARSILDVPNHRSSHTTPTPRGGGVAIAGVVLSWVGAGAGLGWVDGSLAAALIGGGLLVAFIGWRDDRRETRRITRFLMHTAAAGWALYWIGGLPRVELGVVSVELGAAGWLIGTFSIVWLTNLFNFMDGIDGIAGAEAVSVGVIAAMMLHTAGHGSVAWPPLLFAAASLGFLVWNWPPARIFMGDVGSGLIGFAFGVVAIASENRGALPVVAWWTLLGVFIFDATVTLVRRAARGERWYEAHRSHAYQRAVRAGWSHGQVSRMVVGLNVVLGGLLNAVGFVPGGWLGVAVLATALLAASYLCVERLQPMSPSAAVAADDSTSHTPADSPASPGAR